VKRALAVLAVAALAPTARAQTVEITPVIGARFGGGNVNTNIVGDFEPGAGFELDDGGSWGVHLGYQLSGGEIELLYARQGTRLQSDAPFGGMPAFDLAVDIWQVGGNLYLLEPEGRLQAYLGLGLGLTRLVPEPDVLSDETRFSASVAAGGKLSLGAHFGLRAEARAFLTVFGTDGAGFCVEGRTCGTVGTSQLMAQLDLRVGVIFRF